MRDENGRKTGLSGISVLRPALLGVLALLAAAFASPAFAQRPDDSYKGPGTGGGLDSQVREFEPAPPPPAGGGGGGGSGLRGGTTAGGGLQGRQTQGTIAPELRARIVEESDIMLAERAMMRDILEARGRELQVKRDDELRRIDRWADGQKEIVRDVFTAMIAENEADEQKHRNGQSSVSSVIPPRQRLSR